MTDLWETLAPETRTALAEIVRTCPACGTPVSRLAAVGDDDHYVIAEKDPLDIDSTLEPNGHSYRVTVTRHAEIMLCSQIHPRSPS